MKALIAALLIALSPAAFAWRDVMPNAQLAGEGEWRWFGFSIYTARLWQPMGSSAQQLIAQQTPFALELSYHRSISRERFVDASMDEIRRLFGEQVSASQLQIWQAEMQQAFVDVESGMRITGVFLPGEGARFYVNDRLQHRVADPQFARAFFAIWLDPRSRDRDLRQRLLGNPS